LCLLYSTLLAPTWTHTLSLHDALPISCRRGAHGRPPSGHRGPRTAAASCVRSSRALPLRELRHRRALVAAGRQPVQTEDAASPGQFDQRHSLLIAGLEAHGRPGGDVQPHAERLGAIEAQRAVGLEEVKVGAHLDRAVPGVGTGQLASPPTLIGNDVTLSEQVLARNHARVLP